MGNKVLIEVFGAEVVCASCVNAPTSKDTYEWLDAAISRKYPGQAFEMKYIDINDVLTDPREAEIAEQVQNDEYFYPLVLIDGEMVGEGHIQLKPVYRELEKKGFVSA
ncbi:MAG TPA: YuzD family protein [Savagea sp.]